MTMDDVIEAFDDDIILENRLELSKCSIEDLNKFINFLSNYPAEKYNNYQLLKDKLPIFNENKIFILFDSQNAKTEQLPYFEIIRSLFEKIQLQYSMNPSAMWREHLRKNLAITPLRAAQWLVFSLGALLALVLGFSFITMPLHRKFNNNVTTIGMMYSQVWCLGGSYLGLALSALLAIALAPVILIAGTIHASFSIAYIKLSTQKSIQTLDKKIAELEHNISDEFEPSSNRCIRMLGKENISTAPKPDEERPSSVVATEAESAATPDNSPSASPRPGFG